MTAIKTTTIYRCRACRNQNVDQELRQAGDPGGHGRRIHLVAFKDQPGGKSRVEIERATCPGPMEPVTFLINEEKQIPSQTLAGCLRDEGIQAFCDDGDTVLVFLSGLWISIDPRRVVCADPTEPVSKESP